MTERDWAYYQIKDKPIEVSCYKYNDVVDGAGIRGTGFELRFGIKIERMDGHEYVPKYNKVLKAVRPKPVLTSKRVRISLILFTYLININVRLYKVNNEKK